MTVLVVARAIELPVARELVVVGATPLVAPWKLQRCKSSVSGPVLVLGTLGVHVCVHVLIKASITIT